jgi:hypothetical protein
MISEIWRERIFNDISEQRKSYQVTYFPINLQSRNFATLHLTFEKFIDSEETAKFIEMEFDIWINKFSAPIMVTAFSKEDDQVIHLDSVRKSNNLYGYLDNNNCRISSWDIAEIHFPDEYYNFDATENIYKGIEYTTRKSKEETARKYIKEKKLLKNVFDLASFIWLSVTVLILMLGLVNIIVGSIALLYSLYMTVRKYMRFKGFYTNKEKAEKDKLRKMNHYYYHCELNPDGFLKLKIENLQNSNL